MDSEVVQASNTVPHLKVQAVVSEAVQANSMVPHLKELAAVDSVDAHRSSTEPHLPVPHLSSTEPHPLVPHPSNMEPHQLEPHLSSTELHLVEALLLSNTVPHLLHPSSTEPQAVETDTVAVDTMPAPRLEVDSRKLRLAATPRTEAVDTLPTEVIAPAVRNHPFQPPSHSHTLKPEATTTKH